MKRTSFFTAVAAVFALGSSAAWADCRDELAQMTGGISKDGSHAPLGADAELATSGQDVEAQQEGDATAATQADAGSSGDGHDTDRQAALDKAQAALDAGDEAACMEALNEAKAM